ncbi:CAF1-domain-containing protein [Daldinia sp. FL1419]|nr:CAF1-domain-containing protein [Daldinia sp. FL1419]
MEVHKGNFFWMLPRMLDEAQNARFVAVDLEMSGIPFIQGLTSIQDSYTKIKEAADGFQVLQLGLTFIRYDERLATHSIKTFCCPVSPLFPKVPFNDYFSRHLDRRFGVSARTYDFLHQNKFDFKKALDNGAHYLSRAELRLAKEFCLLRDPGNKHVDLFTLDDESRFFYEGVQEQIAKFAAIKLGAGRETVIENPFGNKLNGLQIRLIHQILREEYPSYQATKGTLEGTMSITPIEEAKIESRHEWNLAEVNRLSGLQILLEALAGGSFADRLKQEYVYLQREVPEQSEKWNEFNKNFDFEKCEASLKRKRPILVGHNLLIDLAFIYRTFFEPLPSKVDDFLTEINKLFPRIVDTKFMYGRGRHMMEPDRSLQQLYASFLRNPLPTIKVESGGISPGPHDAGYDSYLTARLFIKQTYALFMNEAHLIPFNQDIYAAKKRDDPSDPQEKESSDWIIPACAGGSNLLDQDDDRALIDLRNWTILDVSASSWTTYSRESKPESLPSETTYEESASGPDEICSENETDIIPRWTDAFWRAYGNKCSVPGAGYVSFEPVSEGTIAEEPARSS